MFEFKGSLKEAYVDYFVDFAVCESCKTFFADDVPMYGPLFCPRCKGMVLVRGKNIADIAQMIHKDEIDNAPR